MKVSDIKVRTLISSGEPNEGGDYFSLPKSKKNTIHDLILDGLDCIFIVADLDRDDRFNDFMKIEYAYAVGVLVERKVYRGIGSEDETWTYIYWDEEGSKSGVAVVRDNKIVDYYQTGIGI